MGFILLGILLSVFLLFITIRIFPDSNDFIFSSIIVIIFLGGVTVGIFVPVSGYEEKKEYNSVELVNLRDGTASEGNGNLFYVSITASNSYTYYVEVESEYTSATSKAYKSETISDSNVTIVEGDFTGAKLVTYVKKGKKTFWTFALFDQIEDVFYVPTGTVSRNISLG